MNAESVRALTQRIEQEFGYTVCIAGEIECSIHASEPPDNALWQALIDLAKADQIPLESIGREQSHGCHALQYECRFTFTDPSIAGNAINWVKDTLPELARSREDGVLSFDAYDTMQDCVNGLHWHLHLLDANQKWVFFKREEELSEPLRHALAGLLFTVPDLQSCFLPNANSLARIQSGKDHVPTTRSWGGNNRTVLLRLPESVVPHRHIEHRLCGADASAYEAVWAILVGLHYGLSHQPELSEQYFGDANRKPNDLPEIRISEGGDAPDWLDDYR